MSGNAFYLRATADGWRVYPLTGNASEPGEPLEAHDTDAVPRALSEACATHKQPNARLVLGLPASWCLCAAVTTEGLPNTRRQQWHEALGFRLEAQLPITIEDYTCGFIGESSERLGVATQTDRLLKLVRALEDHGHDIEAIAPAGFLAAQAWQGAWKGDAAQPGVRCWRDEPEHPDQAAQLLFTAPGRPPRWRCVSVSAEAIRGQLALDGVEVDRTQWCATDGTADLLRQAIQHEDGALIRIQPLSPALDAELGAARAVIAEGAAPWVNLNRGALAPRRRWRRLRVPAYAATAAAMLLLATASALLLWRGHQYRQIAETYDAQAAQAFAEALPGHAVPPSPQRRLKGRLQQLRGEQGLAGGGASLSDDAPVLALLRDALHALPEGQRFVVTDLRLEDGELRLTGHARSHGEADQLAGALRQASRFLVEPPSTENLTDGGVRFTLQATWSPPPPEVATPPEVVDASNEDRHGGEHQPAAPSSAPSLADQRAGGARP